MPVYNRCKLCKALVILAEMGSKGVCKTCMENAINNASALDEETKRQAELSKVAEANAKKSDEEAEERRGADEKAAKEAQKAKEAEDSKVAAKANKTAGKGTVNFTITNGEESYVCDSYAMAAEKMQCHHASIAAAVRRKAEELKDWKISYPAEVPEGLPGAASVDGSGAGSGGDSEAEGF